MAAAADDNAVSSGVYLVHVQCEQGTEKTLPGDEQDLKGHSF